MRIEIPSNLSNAQKGKIIARNESIPIDNLNFEVDPKFAKLISEMYNAYNTDHCRISNEFLYIDRYVEWNALHGYEKREPATLIQEKYANGEIALGASVDIIFGEIQQLEEKKDAQRIQEKADADAAAEKEKIEKPLREARERKYAEEKEIRDAEEKVKKDAEASRLSAEKETRRLTRLAWAQKHGSDQLRKGLEQGYSCIKLYEEEFSRLALGEGYVWDRDNAVEEKTRSCPSLEALKIVEELIKDERIGQGNADIQWLPDGLSALVKDEDWDEDTKGCEAISVKIKGITGLWYKVMA